jgi:hypothetical protein
VIAFISDKHAGLVDRGQMVRKETEKGRKRRHLNETRDL